MLAAILDERARRVWAATETRELGRGGVSLVARATGVSRTTIYQGLAELRGGEPLGAMPADRVRALGGGRKSLTERDPQLVAELERLVEHRMFSFISLNWRGQPWVSHAVIVNLIGGTRTRGGLTIQAQLDTKRYPTGAKVTDEALSKVNLTRATFHGEWNYSIAPNCPT